MIYLVTFLISLGVGGVKAHQDHSNLPSVRVAREEKQMDRESVKSFNRMLSISERLSDGDK